MFVPNFKIPAPVVPEKSLTDKKFTNTHKHNKSPQYSNSIYENYVLWSNICEKILSKSLYQELYMTFSMFIFRVNASTLGDAIIDFKGKLAKIYIHHKRN